MKGTRPTGKAYGKHKSGKKRRKALKKSCEQKAARKKEAYK